MTDGWGRDYSLPEPPKSSKRWWVLAGAIAVVVVWVGLAILRNDLALQGGSLAGPTDPEIYADDDMEVLPTHAATVDNRGLAVAAPVGDWEVAVLETNRNATEDWTEEQMDVGFDAALVMTTVYVKYNGEAPTEFTEALGWDFGSQSGTNNGYNPWDDWCPTWRDSVLEVGTMLPGEARVVRVCVPVASEDAAGLEMHVTQGPGNFDGPMRTFELPTDGTSYGAPEGASVNTPYQVAMDNAQDSGPWRGDTYGAQRSWILDSGQEDENGEHFVHIAATFDVERSPAPLDTSARDPELRGPSGRVYWPHPCPDSDLPNTSDLTAPEIQVCWYVLAEDAHDLVAVFADVWWTGEWLVLRIPETSDPPPSYQLASGIAPSLLPQ